MTKVRTVIPINAKPGKSVIQVTHPTTGRPVRAKVPRDAIPGQTVELDIPDDSKEQDNTTESTARGESRLSGERRSSQVSDIDGTKKPELYTMFTKTDNLDTTNLSTLTTQTIIRSHLDLLPQATEQPVENTVYYAQTSGTPVHAGAAVVNQPVYVSHPVGVQPVVTPAPVIYHQPLVYEQKPNVVIVKDSRQTINDEDCCAAMFAACACTWLLLILTGRS